MFFLYLLNQTGVIINYRGFAIIMSMEPNLQNKLSELEAKIDAIFVSTEKTRKYFLVVMWVTLAAVLLPLIGLLFAIPTFINTYNEALNGLM